MDGFRELTRKQLDERFETVRSVDLREVPRGGWVRTIREALQMTSRALGRRIGVSQSAVSQLEARERAETITLASLQRLATGLDCQLVYALIPRSTLRGTMRRQARRRARSMVEAVARSMELEGQGISDEDRITQERTLEESLLGRPSTSFWDESSGMSHENRHP